MAFVEKTCQLVRCDGCGIPPEGEADYHWDNAREGLWYVTDSVNGLGWIQVGDNQVYCWDCTEYDEEEDEFRPKLTVVKGES